MIVPLLRFSRGCLACPAEPLIRQPGHPSSGPSLAGGSLFEGRAGASSGPEPRPRRSFQGRGMVLSSIQGGPGLLPSVPGPWLPLRTARREPQKSRGTLGLREAVSSGLGGLHAHTDAGGKAAECCSCSSHWEVPCDRAQACLLPVHC